MQINILYKTIRSDGGITVSPNKSNEKYTEMYRIIADDGKFITFDGTNTFTCIDIESIDGWYEIDAPKKEMIWSDTDV